MIFPAVNADSAIEWLNSDISLFSLFKDEIIESNKESFISFL